MSSGSNGTSERSLFLMAGSGAGVCAFLLHGLLANRPAVPSYEPPHYPAPEGVPAVAAAISQGPSGGEPVTGGEALYKVRCAGCHQANGEGLPGAFPPLKSSSWVVKDPETPIRIALLGLNGPIEVEGQKFESVMPMLALSDGEIADIVSYVRSAWGNQADPVTPQHVATVRSSLAGRTTAWDAPTLSSLRDAQ